MTYVYQGHIEKIPILEEILRQERHSRRTQIAYIGDDLTDVPMMRRVGAGLRSANARPEVKRRAPRDRGVRRRGRGARSVRVLLKAQGHWARYPEEIRGGMSVEQSKIGIEDRGAVRARDSARDSPA